jgi:hypothetical protein
MEELPRAKRDALVAGSAAYLTVGETVACLNRELHYRFGTENITKSGLERYVRVDHARSSRECVQSA